MSGIDYCVKNSAVVRISLDLFGDSIYWVIKDIQAGEELLVDYGYSPPFPQWYEDAKREQLV